MAENNNDVSAAEASVDELHPVIRNILLAPNLFAVLGLQPGTNYTDAEIEEAFTRQVRKLLQVVNENG